MERSSALSPSHAQVFRQRFHGLVPPRIHVRRGAATADGYDAERAGNGARFLFRLDAEHSLAYAAMAMRNYYDKTHIRKWFSPGDHVYLRLDNGYNIQANQGGPASRSVRVVKWAEVEKQLRKWCNLLRIGKKITIEIAFTYREDDSNSIPPSRKVEKKRPCVRNQQNVS